MRYPDERFGIDVVVGNVVVSRKLQLCHAGETESPDPLVGAARKKRSSPDDQHRKRARVDVASRPPLLVRPNDGMDTQRAFMSNNGDNVEQAQPAST